ncbi:L,D-transpeptidase family protein [Mucilaginibacter sp. CAU 1740]|uniref:L,D-transpeptidase family protein n=1 Tax=Mucilaginibacter sp. CAU 1740 TaxID=3140365 RepID=UPI00325BA637
MKTHYLSLTFLTALFYCSCHSAHKKLPYEDIDSVMKIIPANIDTTIILKDGAGNMLHFRQYILTLLNNEGIIYREKEILRLQRFTKTGTDSLNKDDHAIARWDRSINITERHPKTITEIFESLAAISASADSVIVFKHRRTMYLKRKGKNITTFKINLGGNPVGDKICDGDLRTPEGVYYLDNKANRTDKFYKSFWISYPDSADRADALKRKVKPGIGVMVHGTSPQRVNSKDWTNGCIALKNNDMDTLFSYVMAGTSIDIRK